MLAPWSPGAWADWNLFHAKIIPPLNNGNVPISMGSRFLLLNAERIALHSGVWQQHSVRHFTLIWIHLALRGSTRGGIKDHLMTWCRSYVVQLLSYTQDIILVPPHTTMKFRAFTFAALSLLAFSECEELLPVYPLLTVFQWVQLRSDVPYQAQQKKIELVYLK